MPDTGVSRAQLITHNQDKQRNMVRVPRLFAEIVLDSDAT